MLFFPLKYELLTSLFPFLKLRLFRPYYLFVLMPIIIRCKPKFFSGVVYICCNCYWNLQSKEWFLLFSIALIAFMFLFYQHSFLIQFFLFFWSSVLYFLIVTAMTIEMVNPAIDTKYLMLGLRLVQKIFILSIIRFDLSLFIEIVMFTESKEKQ